MFAFALNRSRTISLVASVLAASALAGCGSDGNSPAGSGAQCTLELPAATSDAQLQPLIHALQASGDPCGRNAPLPSVAMRANTSLRASSSELVSIDRGDALRLVFAVRAPSE